MSMTSQPSSGETSIAEKLVSGLALCMATFFYSGYIKRAPGSVASLLTVLIWILPIQFGATLMQRLLVAVILLVVGVWAAKKSLSAFNSQRDPSAIVIDEVAGQTIALAYSQSYSSLLIAFVLFRLFDILKPGLIGWLDRKLKGGIGIMLDDVAAGFVSLGLIFLAHNFWPMIF